MANRKCQFLIGPMCSWFMPGTSDILTIQSRTHFIYGCIGCFCYGEIQSSNTIEKIDDQQASASSLSAIVKHLIDVKEDNSRVSCVRFLKKSIYPVAIILTESGSLLIHDCGKQETLFRLRKSEFISKFIDPNSELPAKNDKRTKINHVASCVWPDIYNVFVGVCLTDKDEASSVYWLKFRDITSTNREDAISSYEKLDLIGTNILSEKVDREQRKRSPICCMDSTLLDAKNCLIAVALDDTEITVVKVNFEQGQANRVIKLNRHKDQICSLSINISDKRYLSGLLASVSRDGLVLIWDIEKGTYFAEHSQASHDNKSKPKINWFTLNFVALKDNLSLVVSNVKSGLSILDIPENVKQGSKISLTDKKDKQVKQTDLRHMALLFNVVSDPLTGTLMTSSLDGNHIVWRFESSEQNLAADKSFPKLRPVYLFPTMPNNSRTHMLRHHPINTKLIGISMGKAGVRFYDIPADIDKHKYNMNASYRSIANAITKDSLSPTSIAWHPLHEYKVAIGTLEGKVLEADLRSGRSILIEAKKKSPAKVTTKRSSIEENLFDVDYQPLEREESLKEEEEGATGSDPKTDGVYSLCWGPKPTCPKDISKVAIYAVSSITHRLSIFYSKSDGKNKMTNYLDEYLDQSLPEAIGEASEIAWKSSMDLMALGTTNRKIIIVSYTQEPDEDKLDYLFTRLAVIVVDVIGGQSIQCLAWHTTTDKEDERYYWIAASTKDSAAFVFNTNENTLAEVMRTRLNIEEKYHSSMSDANIVIATYKYKLDAHRKSISDIAWNPHEPNELATSSFDRQCYVWSIDSFTGDEARIVSKFSARDRLFTLDWSLVEADLIFTSGHDSTIWAWRPSENRGN